MRLAVVQGLRGGIGVLEKCGPYMMVWGRWMELRRWVLVLYLELWVVRLLQ